MAEARYKVIQWATGTVGTFALRHFIENPIFELVGVYVTNPDKVDKDAGGLVGGIYTGVRTTGSADAILAMNADCVHFAPLVQDISMICALLRSGKNVVSPLGPYFRTERLRSDWEAIDEACADGGSSFHGSGIHPGFAGDLLPLTLARLMNRVDRIHVHEVVDMAANPSPYIPFMGFGRDCNDLQQNPSRSSEAPHFFAQSMALLAEALGKEIDNLTARFEVAAATRNIPYPGGVVAAGTAAGQRYEWTGWSQGNPLITYYSVWVLGEGNIDAAWDCSVSGYRVVIDGDPPLELTLRVPPDQTGAIPYCGLQWTAMAGLTSIPAVCNAKPGLVTHTDLGIITPHGLVRSEDPGRTR